jgi:type IV pilus assembly protein PilX
MMKKTCGTMMAPVNNEGGFTMILALILLMLLTIIGVAAINTSSTETMIATADEEKRTAFYAADSAVAQVTALLYQGIRDRWQAPCIMSPGTRPNWNFALDGDFFPVASPQPTTPSPPWFSQYSAGVPIATGTLSNGYSFDARAWNNTDIQPASATPTTAAQSDTDGLLVLGVIARSPRDARVAIEVVLNGGLNGIAIVNPYSGQAGGGAGKNYNAADGSAISVGNMGAMSNPGGVLR